MEWLNLSITQLSAPEVRRSSFAERGVWQTLLSYCVQQENAGRITGAESWSDFECNAVLGVPKSEIEGCHHLWSYDQGDILVSGYPHDKQREIAAKRKAARKGNRMRWDTDTHSDSQSASHSDSHSDSDSESGKERKGKEGEGKEKEKGKTEDRALRAQSGKPSSLQEVEAYASEIGLSRGEALKFFDHFEANGWRQGGRTAIKDWRASARNWSRRAGEFGGPGASSLGKSRGGSGGAVAPFDPKTPHAHTGGLEVFNEAPAAGGTGGGA